MSDTQGVFKVGWHDEVFPASTLAAEGNSKSWGRNKDDAVKMKNDHQREPTGTSESVAWAPTLDSTPSGVKSSRVTW